MRTSKVRSRAQAFAAWDPPTLRRATAFYEQAVALDSSFGLAWARSAQAYANLYGASSTIPGLAEAARRRLEPAQRLAPTAAETYRARVDYEALVRHDNLRALAIAEEGLVRHPASSELMASAAIIELILGRLDAAAARLTRAAAIDPQSFIVAHFSALVTYLQRRWPEARRGFERALSLAPTDLGAIEFRLSTFLSEGDLTAARRVMDELPGEVNRMQLAAALSEHDLFWVLDRPTQDRVLALSPAAFDDDRAKWGQVLAEGHLLQGNRRLAKVYADSARIAVERQLAGVPDDGYLNVYRGHRPRDPRPEGGGDRRRRAGGRPAADGEGRAVRAADSAAAGADLSDRGGEEEGDGQAGTAAHGAVLAHAGVAQARDYVCVAAGERAVRADDRWQIICHPERSEGSCPRWSESGRQGPSLLAARLGGR